MCMKAGMKSRHTPVFLHGRHSDFQSLIESKNISGIGTEILQRIGELATKCLAAPTSHYFGASLRRFLRMAKGSGSLVLHSYCTLSGGGGCWIPLVHG